MQKTTTDISFKINSIGQRFTYYFRLLPTRINRLFRHLGRGLLLQINKKEYWKDEAINSSWASVFLLWLCELVVLFLECLGIGEFYETLMDIGKSQSRPMSPREINLAKTIYGNSIDYQRVRVDETAWLGPKQYRFCYVSFHLINSWKSMSEHIFIHELMHIWQYQRMGAIYMIRALIAQHTQMGYNYGGIAAIHQKMAQGQNLLDFNLEQQADVVTDYFLLKTKGCVQWGAAAIEDLTTYRQFLMPLFHHS